MYFESTMCVCVCVCVCVCASDIGGSGSPLVSPGKAKQPRYELNKHQRALIKADAQNKKIWEEVLASTRVEGTVRDMHGAYGSSS